MDLNSSESSGAESAGEEEEAAPAPAVALARRRKKGKQACFGRPKRGGRKPAAAPAAAAAPRPPPRPPEVRILEERDVVVQLVPSDVEDETSDDDSEDEGGAANDFARHHARAAKRALRCVPVHEREAWLALPLAEQLRRTQQLGRPKRARKAVEKLTVTTLSGPATRPYKSATPRGVRSRVVLETDDDEPAVGSQRRKRASAVEQKPDVHIILDADEAAASAGSVSPAACPFEPPTDATLGEVQDDGNVHQQPEPREQQAPEDVDDAPLAQPPKPLKKRLCAHRASFDLAQEPAQQPDASPELVSEGAPNLPIANASWRRPRAKPPLAAPPLPLPLPRSLLIVGPDVPPPAAAPQASEDYLDRVQREARERLHSGTAPARV